MSEFLAEMQFGAEGQRETLSVRTFHDGTLEVAATDGYDHGDCPLTLGQAIQLRDFLNRHIDGLALQQIGSLAVRSDDGSDQLDAVEEVPACANSVDYFGGVYRCGMRSSFSRDPVLCPSCCEKQKR